MRVVVLFGDRHDRARLSAALAGHALVTPVERLPDARRLVRAPGTVAAVVCVTAAEITTTLAAVRDLRDRFPALAIIVYCDLHTLARRLLVALVRAGASDVMFRGVDDGRAVVLDALAAAVRQSHADDVRARLGSGVDDALRPLLWFGLQTPQAADDVDAAAASLGLSRRTLTRRLAALGAPSPRRFFRWTRLLLAGALLRERGRTLPSVAHELHFESVAALRLQLRRYAGAGVTSSSPQRVGRDWLFERVCTAFLTELGAAVPSNAASPPSSGQGAGASDTSR